MIKERVIITRASHVCVAPTAWTSPGNHLRAALPGRFLVLYCSPADETKHASAAAGQQTLPRASDVPNPGTQDPTHARPPDPAGWASLGSWMWLHLPVLAQLLLCGPTRPRAEYHA
ncbi:hypothetical protein ACCO45_011434 [Purpureocillium lilacinum]|uniref:Uncharacterized protein n=1 Tax=Purpureocillium lilacinum TaxID=33203 RepID=A0ACC4DBQ3_PURLI